MTITIVELARRLGVSKSTVSNVVNNHKHITPELRERVQTLIRETGYRPNSAARRLVKSRTFTIGVVIPGRPDFQFSPMHGEILRGISDVATDLSYDILLRIPHASQDSFNYGDLVTGSKADGVLVIFPGEREAGIRALEKQNCPAVLLNSKSSVLDYVDVDNRDGAEKAVRHLVRQGRTRIGMINGNLGKSGFRARYEAYRRVLEEENLPHGQELVVQGFVEFSDPFPPNYSVVQNLLQHKVDAIFAASDALARVAVKAVKDAGLRIPQDVAVVGFDDAQESAHMEPPLTTVRQPFFDLGREAMKLLAARIEDTAAARQHRILPCDFIIRESA